MGIDGSFLKFSESFLSDICVGYSHLREHEFKHSSQDTNPFEFIVPLFPGSIRHLALFNVLPK